MSQNYLHRHPQFDIVKFPFIVVSGLEHYSLVNVKDFFAQEFIISSSNTNRGQRSFFFKKEKYGYSFHFSSFELAASNVVHHKWHEMQLKNDYFEKLEQYGLLPDSNLSKKFKMMESYAKYNKEKQKLFPDKETQNISYKTKELQEYQKSQTLMPKKFESVEDEKEMVVTRKTEPPPKKKNLLQEKKNSEQEQEELWRKFQELSKHPDFSKKMKELESGKPKFTLGNNPSRKNLGQGMSTPSKGSRPTTAVPTRPNQTLFSPTQSSSKKK